MARFEPGKVSGTSKKPTYQAPYWFQKQIIANVQKVFGNYKSIVYTMSIGQIVDKYDGII